MGLRECHEADIVLLVPDNTLSSSDDIAGMDRTVTAQAERIEYSFY